MVPFPRRVGPATAAVDTTIPILTSFFCLKSYKYDNGFEKKTMNYFVKTKYYTYSFLHNFLSKKL